MSIREGRFEEPLSKAFTKVNASIGFDRRLFREDIRGSAAYARALGRLGILSRAEERAVVGALSEIEKEIEEGKFFFRDEDEDIHMNVERRLFEKIGEPALKLHTGRSRNEQIVLDERLYVEGAVKTFDDKLRSLMQALLQKAKENLNVIIPAYTHLRQAQLVSLAHLFCAYCEALRRDRERLSDFKKRLSVMPLGSGAAAGSSIGIDRDFLVKELSLADKSRNSIDAVSTRDFICEFDFICACTFITLSRMSEDLIIYSSDELGFVEIPAGLCTTSSLMPQKKNPDSLELIRGKSARVIGNLLAMLTLLKGLPYTYDRDLQEDKEGLFDTVDSIFASLDIMIEIVGGVIVHAGRIGEALGRSLDFIYATDLADYLVEKGLPFRKAHQIVGSIARRGESLKTPLSKLPLEEYRSLCAEFGGDVYELFDPVRSVNRHDVPGGTALNRIEEEIRLIEEELGEL